MTNLVNFRELDLVEGEKYTIVWYDNLTGIVSANIKLVDFYVDRYAQYDDSLFLEVVIGRRKYIQEMTFTPNEAILIVKGNHKISFDSLYTIEEHNGVTHKYSKTLSMSSDWIKAARDQVANYMLDKIDYCDICGKTEIIIPLESYDLESFPDLHNKKVCQGCRAARYGAKINQLEQEQQEEEDQEDAIKKQQGYTFKHSVWIHPARGDDFDIVIYSNKKSINKNKLMAEYNARQINHSVSEL